MQTVFANMRGVVHKGSGGQCLVFPDVCKTPTPGGPVPIPYPNLGQAMNTIAGPVTVMSNGQMPMTKDAKYAMSSMDEPGVVGGIISGTVKGPCEFMLYSFDVMFEGKNVCRLGDPMFHNNRNAMG